MNQDDSGSDQDSDAEFEQMLQDAEEVENNDEKEAVKKKVSLSGFRLT